MFEVSMLSERYRDKLVEIGSSLDIPRRWAGTPIEAYIQAQNFGYPLTPHSEPQLLVCSCIEFRFALKVPAMYAYVIRSAGARLIGAEFAVGYVLSRGVKHILLIAHNDCGMAKIPHHRQAIIKAFVEQGWSNRSAQSFVDSKAKQFAIDDELEGLRQEYYRLKHLFKAVRVAPLFLDLTDGRVHIPSWYQQYIASEAPPDSEPVRDQEIVNLI
jgi:carbonic anhydrase